MENQRKPGSRAGHVFESIVMSNVSPCYKTADTLVIIATTSKITPWPMWNRLTNVAVLITQTADAMTQTLNYCHLRQHADGAGDVCRSHDASRAAQAPRRPQVGKKPSAKVVRRNDNVDKKARPCTLLRRCSRAKTKWRHQRQFPVPDGATVQANTCQGYEAQVTRETVYSVHANVKAALKQTNAISHGYPRSSPQPDDIFCVNRTTPSPCGNDAVGV